MSNPFRPLTAALLLVASVGACASNSTSNMVATPSSGRNIIAESELPTAGTETAYDAITRLRPEFLRARPAQSYNLQPNAGVSGAAPLPALIVNGQRAGEVTDLRQVAATSLRFVRYYTIEEAKRRFGMQYDGGAIEVAYR